MRVRVRVRVRAKGEGEGEGEGENKDEAAEGEGEAHLWYVQHSRDVCTTAMVRSVHALLLDVERNANADHPVYRQEHEQRHGAGETDNHKEPDELVHELRHVPVDQTTDVTRAMVGGPC